MVPIVTMKGPCIYFIECVKAERTYVGSTSCSASNRISNHKFHLRRGSHCNKAMQADWNKYGEDAFSFRVCKGSDLDEILKKEADVIAHLGTIAYNEVKPPKSLPADICNKYARFSSKRPKGPEKLVFKRSVTEEQFKRLEEILLMDTSSFDKKMEEYRKIAKTGAPFPYEAPKAPDSKPKEAYIIGDEGKETPNEVEELKKQLMALLEDNEKLTTLVSNQEAKIQRVARLTDNEKLILWIRKYDELKKVYDVRFGGSEFSQT